MLGHSGCSIMGLQLEEGCGRSDVLGMMEGTKCNQAMHSSWPQEV